MCNFRELFWCRVDKQWVIVCFYSEPKPLFGKNYIRKSCFFLVVLDFGFAHCKSESQDWNCLNHGTYIACSDHASDKIETTDQMAYHLEFHSLVDVAYWRSKSLRDKDLKQEMVFSLSFLDLSNFLHKYLFSFLRFEHFVLLLRRE